MLAISLLGLFSNFAQNGDSWFMMYGSYGAIGIIFLVEALVLLFKTEENKTQKAFLFIEHFFLFIMFIAFYFKFNNWLGAHILMVLGAGIVSAVYLMYGISFLVKYKKTKRVISILIMFFSITLFFNFIAFVFRFQFWSGAKSLCLFATILSLITLLFFRKRNFDSPNSNRFNIILKNTQGKMMMLFVFLSFWVGYSVLVDFGIAPKLYSNNRPPLLNKMLEERFTNKTHSPEEMQKMIDTYSDNYENFIYNRQQAEKEENGEK